MYFCKLVFLEFRFYGMLLFILKNLINLIFLLSNFLFNSLCGLIILILNGSIDLHPILSQLLSYLMNQADRIFIVICILIILLSNCLLFFRHQFRYSLLDICLIFFIDGIFIDLLTLLILRLLHQ